MGEINCSKIGSHGIFRGGPYHGCVFEVQVFLPDSNNNMKSTVVLRFALAHRIIETTLEEMAEWGAKSI